MSVKMNCLLMFKPRMKKLDFDLKLKLNDEKLYSTKSVKYRGATLTWNEQVSNIAIKLNRPNAKLYETSYREFVNTRVVKLICHDIFDCHLNHANTAGVRTKIHEILYSYYRISKGTALAKSKNSKECMICH